MNEKLLNYFNGDDLASNVWQSKYAQEGEETPDDMHRRLAKEFYKADKKYQYIKGSAMYNNKHHLLSEYGQNRKEVTEDIIYKLLKDFKYIIPQGSIMASLGTPIIASLSNCWVNESPLDSYAGIMKSDSELAFYYKRRGGVGQDLSLLRPKGLSTNNTAKTTTGAVSFMPRFSNTTREVAMDGRRGALMLSMAIEHPDSMEFIKIKRDSTSITGANISLKLSNSFMKAVEKEEDFILKYPTDAKLSLSKYDEWYPEWSNGELHYIPKDDCYVKVVSAKEYWKEIIISARNHAEPGLLYWDNAMNYDPSSVYDQYQPTSTNPCGEQFLNPNDSCRLMALNLYSFISNPFTKDAKLDEELLFSVVYEFARMGDNLVDLELEYIQKIIDKIKSDPEPKEVKRTELKLWQKSYKNTEAGRRVGLGITALADMLAAMGIKYDSKEGFDFVEKVMRIKKRAELICSTDLAIIRGTFLGWDVNKEFSLEEGIYRGKNLYYQTILEEFPKETLRMIKYGRRSLSDSTIAPTGTVSLMTQTTSGCEPLFLPWYKRRKKINPSDKNSKVDFVDDSGDKWQEFFVLHPKFKTWLKIVDPDIPEDVYGKEYLEGMFSVSPWYKATANDIDWGLRNKMQALLQKYTTNAISSTINLPNTVTEEDVSKIYLDGWKLGLKGQTVYVNGSRSGVLVEDKKEEKLVTFNENHAPKRPKKLPSKIIRFNNNYEKWVAFVGLMDGKPYEIFTGKLENVNLPNDISVGEIVKVYEDGVKRYDFNYSEGVVKGISNVFNTDFWNYGKLISGMLRHGMPLPFVVSSIQDLTWEEEHINTWKNGIARALKKFIKDGKAEGVKCSDCNSNNIVFQEGCLSCLDCGSSKCG